MAKSVLSDKHFHDVEGPNALWNSTFGRKDLSARIAAAPSAFPR